MTMERLSMVAPSLARTMKQTRDDRRLREAACVAARQVARRAAVTDERMDRALSMLAAGETDEVLRRSLAELLQQLDEQAWDVQEAHDDGRASQKEYLEAFARARAVGAVVAALDVDPEMAALEATYEAHCAFADGSDVLDAVARSLTGDAT